MPRFDRLEFGQPTPDEPDADEPKLSRSHDERHWLKQADTNRRKGQYENALRFYSRALEENKAMVAAWTGQVQMLVLLNEVPEADLWARKALEIFSGNGELLAARAQSLCRIGDKKQAMPLCDAALAAAGKSAYRWQVRGELMVATKQSLDTHCFDKAQEVERDWLVPLESALIYLHYGFASRAQVRARQAVESAPDQFYCWYVRGCAEAELNFERQARESFETCLKLCPRHVDATAGLENLQRGWSLKRTLRRLFSRD